ncbi:hypothetical protein B566_EDAN014114 [Ephemera danica]|nr:hypothetical protein B566_EDAN014114 [Ephemera danica]
MNFQFVKSQIPAPLAIVNVSTFERPCRHFKLFLHIDIVDLESGSNFMLIHLLAVEEEEVWRAVLAWAKHQAGVTQPTAHWAEEERARVCQHLAGVIGHVRLLLIDSQVFAEEVEPTGAVPIELSLERYRFAALPNKFREQSEDKRLQPRMSCKLFPGSQLLNMEKSCYQRILNEWYGPLKQQWRLVFRASTHGWSAQAFHRACDGVSPTYTIVAVSDVAICNRNMHNFNLFVSNEPKLVEHDNKKCRKTLPLHFTAWCNFVFKLRHFPSSAPDCCIFVTLNHDFACRCGPVFGAGADLAIAGNCNRNSESYSNLPHSYDGEGASPALLMGDYNFCVHDYEVFTPVEQ